MTENVILLHGIFRTSKSMRGFEGFLKQSGYNVLNVSYPSTKHSIETLADIIHPRISDFILGCSDKTHFIGFSMGGLVIRAYLNKYRPAEMGRVVLLGTPNKGSEVADFLQNFSLYKRLYGPAGQQLVTNQQSFKAIFGAVNYELGIIAGNKSIDPVSSFIIGKPNDGKVSIDSAFMEEAADQVIIGANHTFFPTNRTMWAHALSFLKAGRFPAP